MPGRYGNTRKVSVVPVINTVQFSANDAVGGLNTLDGLGSVAGSGVLKHVTVTDLDNQKAALTIVFFESQPAGTFTNNSAFPNLSAADLAKVIGKVEIAASDYTTLNARAVATKECSTCLWARGDTPGGNTQTDKRTIYMAVMTSGTPTYTAATSLELHLGVLLD